MRAVIACPDRHLFYDGRTPDQTGVGGGVTVRVRAAAALARRGVEVTVIGNCRRKSTDDGVLYIPLDEAPRMETDVLLVHSSGGALDLEPDRWAGISTRLRLVMVSGVAPVKGLPEINPDLVYLPSNFLRRYAMDHWGVAGDRIFVTPHGVTRPRRWLTRSPRRNPFRLLYPSHPAKGLNAALSVWETLRTGDSRFQLEICGGDRLWGGIETRPAAQPGLTHSGLLGQKALFRRFERAGFVIQLQAIPEGFGISVMEAMAAGCIVLASPVGAYAETVNHGYNGFLIEGPHMAAATHAKAGQLIRDLVARPDDILRLRRNAAAGPLEWDVVAAAWIEHWKWLLAGKKRETEWSRCVLCGRWALSLADGYHCTACGHWSEKLPQPNTCTPAA